jgi:hypothetical protein
MTLFTLADRQADDELAAPHPFWPVTVTDWGFRPYCRVCGGEAKDPVHRKVPKD